MTKLKEVSAEDEEESLGIKTNQLFGDWKIVKKLDEGGFGKVFKVENVKTAGRVAALKAESSKSIGGACIKLEIAVLKLLNKNNSKMYIPQLFRARRRKRFHYMVVTLLGENLRSLRTDSKSGRISAETWSRLAIQCLYGIKLVHEIGYIHRDIKPPNFVMGHRSDANRVRVVHVLDFGMARQFARFDGDKWIARKARPSCDFRGTYRYCSPNVHAGREQSRADDVWSLMYILIEMHCGLPWRNESDKKRMAFMKLQVPDNLLMKNFPVEMHQIIPALRKLNYYNRPDYSMIHAACVKLMKSLKVSFDDPYDWETDKDVEHIIRHRTRNPDYDEKRQKYFDADARILKKMQALNETEPGGLNLMEYLRSLAYNFIMDQ